MNEFNNNFRDRQSLKDRMALLRISRWSYLDKSTLETVKNELLDSLNLVEYQVNAGTRSELNQTNHDFIDLDSPQQKLSIKARHLINSGVPWSIISDQLWQDFKSQPSAASAARFLEIAFVQAPSEETLAYFNKVMSSNLKGFYWYLHPKLRDFLVEFAPEQNIDQLYWILAKERDDSKLSGLEHTFIFLKLATTSEKTACWAYFRKHQRKILEAFNRGTHFGMTKSKLIIRAGELALGVGYFEDAKELYQQLAKGTPEHETALQLLIRFEGPQKSKVVNSYAARLESLQDWKERITLLSSYCDTSRKLGGIQDTNRASLDLIFKNVVQLVPKNNESWRALGELLVRHRDLNQNLPNLFKAFFDNSIIFHGPDIDGALWGTAFVLEPKNDMEIYLNSIACIHKYATSPKIGEKYLWKALEQASQLTLNKSEMPWTIKEILKTAYHWVSSATIFHERDKKRSLAGLKLALEGILATKDSVENYIQNCGFIPQSLIHSIAMNAAATGQIKFATSLLVKAGSMQSFSNSNLEQLWKLASKDPASDLSWRIATVLGSREALHPNIKHTWEISGERRAVYTPQIIAIQDIEAALTDLSPGTKKLAHALCILGTKINELNIINGAASHHIPPLAGGSTTEQAIVSVLKNTKSIPQPTKAIAESVGIHNMPLEAAPLAQAIINGPWLFATRIIAERLSITSWGWNVQTLQTNAKTILPLVGKDTSGKSSAKLAKWISSMDSNERSAWNDIVSCSHAETPERLSIDLVKFICRLSVILYPSHLTALKTLQQLRMPLEILRDLESFILSEPLGIIRSQKGITTRVSVPETLKSIFT